MAKGDVTMKFDAQTSQFIANVLKARDAMDQGADKARKFGAETAAAGEKANASMQRTGSLTQSVTGGVVALGGALTLLTAGAAAAGAAMEKSFERQKLSADLANKSVQTLVESLAAAGRLSALPQVRSGLRGAGGDVFKQSDVEQTAGEYLHAFGKRISPQQAIDAAKAAVSAGATGMSLDDSKSFGRTVLELGTIPGLKNVDQKGLKELAFKINAEKPEGLSDFDSRLIRRSPDAFHGIDMVLAGARSKEAAKGLESLEEIATQDIDPAKVRELRRHQHSRKFTDEDRRTLRLADIAPEDREQAILRDKTLAPDSKRRLLDNLTANLHEGESAGALQGREFGAAQDQYANNTDPAVESEKKRKASAATIEGTQRGAPEPGGVGAFGGRPISAEAMGLYNANIQRRKDEVKADIAASPFGDFVPDKVRDAGLGIGALLEGILGMKAAFLEKAQGQIDATEDLHESVKYQTRDQTILKNNNPGQQ